MSDSNSGKENLHNKARTSPYPGSQVERSQVPNEKVDWLVEWQDYKPVEYTAHSVLAGPRWADPQINESNFSPKFNEKDGHVERKSQNGLYEIENGRPRNPAGRTGLIGRGLLGRWGPNHAADPIITSTGEFQASATPVCCCCRPPATIMIYWDFISHDDMFFNIYKIQEITDWLYLEMEGKMISRTVGGTDDAFIDGNASAEGLEGEGTKSTVITRVILS